jgi:hypothetical protein
MSGTGRVGQFDQLIKGGWTLEGGPGRRISKFGPGRSRDLLGATAAGGWVEIQGSSRPAS